MFRLITRAVPAIAASAIVAALALPTTGMAHAVSRTQPPSHAYSTTTAGWRTGGKLLPGPGYWRFRYITATIKIPSCPGNSVIDNVEANVGLQGFSENPYGVGIGLHCAGTDGAYAHYGWNLPSSNGDIRLAQTLAVGDEVQLTIYFNRSPRRPDALPSVNFTVKDLTTGSTSKPVVQIPRSDIDQVFFRHAGWNSYIDGPNAPLGAQPNGTTLWTFENCWTTTDPTADHPAPLRGGIFGYSGEWATTQEIVTQDGTSNGQVVLWPRSPHNHAFGMSLHQPGF